MLNQETIYFIQGEQNKNCYYLRFESNLTLKLKELHT